MADVPGWAALEQHHTLVTGGPDDVSADIGDVVVVRAENEAHYRRYGFGDVESVCGELIEDDDGEVRVCRRDPEDCQYHATSSDADEDAEADEAEAADAEGEGTSEDADADEGDDQ